MNKARTIKLESGSNYKKAKENLLAENLKSFENLNFVNFVNSSFSHKVDSCRFQ